MKIARLEIRFYIDPEGDKIRVLGANDSFRLEDLESLTIYYTF